MSMPSFIEEVGLRVTGPERSVLRALHSMGRGTSKYRVALLTADVLADRVLVSATDRAGDR